MKPIQSRAGEWVRVKSKEEILKTLDKNGRLEGLPFMPEMFQYCGQRVRVFKRAHKTCDTLAGPVTGYVGRKIDGCAHLEFRCDGKAHGGCQAACLLFWKEAWLERDEDAATGAQTAAPARVSSLPSSNACTEQDVVRATRASASGREPRYVCQATELHAFSQPLKWWDARQYIEDYRSGNASLIKMLRVLTYVVCYFGSLSHRNRLGRPARWAHASLMKLVGGSPMRRTRGKIRMDEPTPITNLNLVPGDLVKVRSFDEITQHGKHSQLESGALIRCRDGDVLWQDLSRPNSGRKVHRRGHWQNEDAENAGGDPRGRLLPLVLQRAAVPLPAEHLRVVARGLVGKDTGSVRPAKRAARA